LEKKKKKKKRKQQKRGRDTQTARRNKKERQKVEESGKKAVICGEWLSSCHRQEKKGAERTKKDFAGQ